MKRGPSTSRDHSSEQHWLLVAELTAGRSGFARHALMRLAAGEHVYGDQWASKTVDELLGELTEEAADIGAWGVLALQSLARAVEIDDERRQCIGALLEDALTASAHAHRSLVAARREIARVQPYRGGQRS